MLKFDGLYYRISKKIKERIDLVKFWLAPNLVTVSEKLSVLDFELVALFLLSIAVKNKRK